MRGSPGHKRSTNPSLGNKTKITAYLISIFLFLFLCLLYASPACAGWAATYGSSNDDSAYSIQQTSDGGYIVAGYYNSWSISGIYYSDITIIKLAPNGSIVWQRDYNDGGYDIAYFIRQTSDGGYIVVGTMNPAGGNTYVGTYGVILKLDPSGNLQWQKSYDYGFYYSVSQTSDSGYIVVGNANLGSAGSAIVLRLDPNGNIVWHKDFEGSSWDIANSVQQTSDGGYIVGGYTYSFGAGACDVWVLKLDSSGNITWQKTYGGAGHDYESSIQQTSDGGYIVTGDTNSFGAGGYDAWVLKLDSGGSVIWQKTYGGTSDEWIESVQQTPDGGYIISGGTSSFGAGGYDAWSMKLDSGGSVIWQKTYGGPGAEYGGSQIEQTSDGGYIVAGYTTSYGAGSGDFWILKLDGNGDVSQCGIDGASNTTTGSSGIAPVNSNATALSPANSGSGSLSPGSMTATVNAVCSSIAVNPSGTVSTGQTVTVNSDKGGINCTWDGSAQGGTCSSSISGGTSVTLTAILPTGTTILWGSGCDSTTTTTCTINYLTGNLTISPTTTAETHTVTPSAGLNGSITPNTPQTINYGSTTSFTVTPDANYHINSVTGCGGTLTGNTYTTGPITVDCAVTASFTIDTYTVTPSAGLNGSISPNTPQTVNYGSTTSFTVMPDANYHINSVTGCGGTLARNIYTTAPITGDCPVTASFAINNHSLTINPGGNGSGSVSSGVGNINCGYNGSASSGTCSDSYSFGSHVTLTATSSNGSNFSGWAGCDSSSGNICYVTMDSDKTVAANFALVDNVTIPSATGQGSIHLSLSCPGCGAYDIQTKTAGQVSNNTAYNFPFGLIEFKINCSSADITITYAGASDLSGFVYRKYGPTIPGDPGTTQWYNFTDVTISGNSVTLHLEDGRLGDDSGVDGIIVDIGGPAQPQPVSIPAMNNWGMLSFALFAGAEALYYLRKREQGRQADSADSCK